MTEETGQRIESLCAALQASFSGVVTWKWDANFGAILGEFDAVRADEVRALLCRHLPARWESDDIDAAPESIRRITKDFGRLTPGQALFASESPEASFLFCVWWPWGNGKTISIRIAPSYAQLPPTEDTAQTRWFRERFRV